MPIAIAALVVGTAVSVGASIYTASKSASAQQQALKYQQQQNDLQAARQQRDAVRQARIAYAQAQQSAVNQGADQSSAAEGGLGSIQTQLGSTLSFLDQYNYLSDQASIQLGKAAAYQAQSKTFGSLASIGEWAIGNPNTVNGLAKSVGKIFG